MGKIRWAFHLLTLVGMVCIGMGVLSTLRTLSFLRHAQTAAGVVVENIERLQTIEGQPETFFCPRVRFTAAGGGPITFEASLSSNPPSYEPGAAVTVLYAPARPEQAEIKDRSLWFGPGLLLSLGSIATSIGLGILSHRRKEQWLRAHGISILADVTVVERRRRIELEHLAGALPIDQMNSDHAWRITCQWLNPATKRIHIFKSDEIRFDPTPHVTDRQIPVAVDPNNFGRYVIDLSFLPLPTEKRIERSITGWPKRKLQIYLDRWHKLTGMSLDSLLLYVYFLCILGLRSLNGALPERTQLSLATVLLLGSIQFSLWQRRSFGWQWPGPEPDLRKKLLIIGGVGLVFFAAAFLFPPSIALPVYLAFAGLFAFNVLRVGGFVTLTHEDFRKSCPGPGSPNAAPEPRWKRRTRTAYQAVFIAVWIAAIAWFFQSGHAAQAPAQSTHLPLAAHLELLLLRPAHPQFLDSIRTALSIGVPFILLATVTLPCLLHIPLYPARRHVHPTRT